MSRAEGLVFYHTSAPAHALLTPAAVAFVAALEKVLWELAYHRPLEAKEGGHNRSGLKDLCLSFLSVLLGNSAYPHSHTPAYFLVCRLQYVVFLESAVGSELLCSLLASSAAEVLSAVEAVLLCLTLNQAEVCLSPLPLQLQVPQDHELWLLSSPTCWKTWSKQRHHSHPHSCTLCARCRQGETPEAQLGLGFFCGAGPGSPEMSVIPESGRGVQQARFLSEVMPFV